MKHLTIGTFILLFVGLLVLGGCAEERTLISRRYVTEGLEGSSGIDRMKRAALDDSNRGWHPSPGRRCSMIGLRSR